MLQIFAAKVVIFFEICNKLGGNVVFFIFSAEFMKKSLYISKYTTNRPCEAVGVLYRIRRNKQISISI